MIKYSCYNLTLNNGGGDVKLTTPKHIPAVSEKYLKCIKYKTMKNLSLIG